MTAFISYFRPDEQTARDVQAFLERRTVSTYLDVLDPGLTPEVVTQRILDSLENSTHLLAIVSDRTVSSWWVPFEIGVARRQDTRIATLDISSLKFDELPEFLKVWPVLIRWSHLDAYARRYLRDTLILRKSAKTFGESWLTEIQTSSDFHQLLKGDLGQR